MKILSDHAVTKTDLNQLDEKHDSALSKMRLSLKLLLALNVVTLIIAIVALVHPF